MSNEKTTAEVLRGALALIEERTSWTTGCDARSSDGLPTDALSSDAVKFCVDGALQRAAHGVGRAYCRAHTALKRQLGMSPIMFNDEGGPLRHWRIKRALRKAIKAAERVGA